MKEASPNWYPETTSPYHPMLYTIAGEVLEKSKDPAIIAIAREGTLHPPALPATIAYTILQEGADDSYNSIGLVSKSFNYTLHSLEVTKTIPEVCLSLPKSCMKSGKKIVLEVLPEECKVIMSSSYGEVEEFKWEVPKDGYYFVVAFRDVGWKVQLSKSGKWTKKPIIPIVDQWHPYSTSTSYAMLYDINGGELTKARDNSIITIARCTNVYTKYAKITYTILHEGGNDDYNSVALVATNYNFMHHSVQITKTVNGSSFNLPAYCMKAGKTVNIEVLTDNKVIVTTSQGEREETNWTIPPNGFYFCCSFRHIGWKIVLMQPFEEV